MTASDPGARESVIAMMQRLRTMPDTEYLQLLIAYHAAPTLLRIKPASLICPDSSGRDLDKALKESVHCLECTFGVRVAGFRNRAGALLILVFAPKLLETVLARREVADLLTEAGYDFDGRGLDGVLETLGGKCAGRCFPHEIGVLLGYPADDVRRFMLAGNGKGSVGCGCWKTYDDNANARRRSERFTRIRLKAAALIAGGEDLAGVVSGLRRGAA